MRIALLLLAAGFVLASAPISVGGGLRYWADSPEGGPQGLGYRAVLALLFPN